MCDEKLEDLNHFMLWYPAYIEERGKNENCHRPNVENKTVILNELLFKGRIQNTTKETIYKFGKRIKEKQELNPPKNGGVMTILF